MSYQGQSTIELKVYRRGNVAVVEMDGNQNRINTMFCDKWMKALDLIESWSDVRALVSTGCGRFYSNGLDTEYLLSTTREQFEAFRKAMAKLDNRLLTFPMVTIAAINGHCFAGGFIFAMVHDYRVMHTGKGWMCLNEVDINMRFPNHALLVLNAKINRANLNQLLVLGERLTAEEALKLQIIHEISPQGKALEHSVNLAEKQTANRRYTRQSLQNMKRDIYRWVPAPTRLEKQLQQTRLTL